MTNAHAVREDSPVHPSLPGPRSLGALIKNRRLELGLTKSEAARRANVSRGTWHEVENGTRTNMMPDTLLLIDGALNWEPGTLSRLSRPLDYPGTVAFDRDGTPKIVEKTPPGIDVAADRRRLAALSYSVPIDVVEAALDLIAALELRALEPGTRLITAAELERFKETFEQQFVRKDELPTETVLAKPEHSPPKRT